jgi:hypothetical protein
VPLAAPDVARCATEVLRALGADPGDVAVPLDERAIVALRARVAALLAAVQPDDAGPSVGELVTELVAQGKRGWADRTAARHAMAELRATFDRAAFRRTRRAERGRAFAQLVVLFDLEPALGAGGEAALDLEDRLRRVRARLRDR